MSDLIEIPRDQDPRDETPKVVIEAMKTLDDWGAQYTKDTMQCISCHAEVARPHQPDCFYKKLWELRPFFGREL